MEDKAKTENITNMKDIENAVNIFKQHNCPICLLKNSFVTFFLFCVLSSIIYVFNDICVYKYDKINPNKRKIKPLANKDVTFNEV